MDFLAPNVLILGHSFVRRLKHDLSVGFDPRVKENFGLSGSANIHLFGIGGRTVNSLRANDLSVIFRTAPEAVILEIGTNDLSNHGPEVVGSDIEDLACFLLREFGVRVVCICHVIPRGSSRRDAASFNAKVQTLHRVVATLSESTPGVFCWFHKGLTNPSRQVLLPDGVHLNSLGQYLLYRSYRGAILKALSMLHSDITQ